MGIKQRFATFAGSSAVSLPLRRVWEDTADSNSTVIVFDGTNVLAQLISHPEVCTESIVGPRLRELEMILRVMLARFLAECPYAEFHFVFDGISRLKELECKEEESKHRKLKRVIECFEKGHDFCRNGYAHRANNPSPSIVIRNCLRIVLESLDGGGEEGRHKMFMAHSWEQDLDMATALHAIKCSARMIVSSDSDFLLLYSGIVVPVNSLQLRSEGLLCRPISLESRCQALRCSCLGEVKVLGALLGSDFNSPQQTLSQQQHKQQDVSTVADKAVELCSSHGSWQCAVRALLKDTEDKGEAFLKNFDTEGYRSREHEDQCESWVCQDAPDVLAFGLTPIYPVPGQLWRSPLDPVLNNMREWSEAKPLELEEAVKRTLDPERILRAYAQGWLSGSKVALLRHSYIWLGQNYADVALDRPFAAIREECMRRLVAYISGPSKVKDSWDDEDDEDSFGHPDTFLVRCCKFNTAETRIHLEPELPKLQELKDMASKGHLTVEERLNLEARMDQTREWLAARLDFDKLFTEIPVQPIDEDLQWMWQVHQGPGDLANAFLYLATGKPLAALDKCLQELVKKCMQHRADRGDQARLYLLCLSMLAGSHLVPRQLQQLRHSLNISKADWHVPGPSFASPGASHDTERCAAAGLVLGGMCTWVLGHLQDCFCLCGGNGLLFPQNLPLDGGPVVVCKGGLVHKAEDGYKVTVSAPRGMPDQDFSEVPDNVLRMVEDRLEAHLKDHSERSCKVTRIKNWLKVTGIPAEQAFWFHRRVVVDHDSSTPYILKVKALESYK